MKVLVLGDEAVGKTSVVKGLAQVAKRSVCSSLETDAMSITEVRNVSLMSQCNQQCLLA